MRLMPWLLDNFPFVFSILLALFTGLSEDYEWTRFWIIMAAMYFILRDLSEIKDLLKKNTDERG